MITSGQLLRVSEVLNSFAKKNRLNCNILISSTEGIQLCESYGYSSFDINKKLNSESVFETASLTKSFVALIILFLEQAKKLDIKDDVCKYLPDFPYKNIKLENLLSHTSGLPDYRTDKSILNTLTSDNYISNNGILEYILNHKPSLVFQPNTNWHYSSTGYILLTLVIELIENRSLQEILDKYIFLPLGMYNTKIPKNHESLEIDSNNVRYYIADKKKNKLMMRLSYFQLNLKSLESYMVIAVYIQQQ